MRPVLTFVPLLACLLAARAPAAGELLLTERAGLFEAPGFEEGGDGIFDAGGVLENGWMCGYSRVSGDSVPWVRNPADGVTRPLTFTPWAEPLGASGVLISGVTESGWLSGVASFSRLSDGAAQRLAWMGDLGSATATPAGLTDAEHTSGTGERFAGVYTLTESGYLWGDSTRYSGGETRGVSVWVADCRTRAVRRVGLFTGPHSRPDGLQESGGRDLTESGWLTGVSARYLFFQEQPEWDPWVASAVTGVTWPVGLPLQEGGWGANETVKLMESGHVAGHAHAASGGKAVWVTDAATGVTRRLGLYEGADYASPVTGAQWSEMERVTDAGWVAGQADHHTETGGQPAGEAAWVADVRTGAVWRVGFFQGPEFLLRGRRVSHLTGLTESGWASGSSAMTTELEDTPGKAAWVAEAATGVTRAMGLTGASFTGGRGERYSEVWGVTESGWVHGVSQEFRAADTPEGYAEAGYALWVARADSGSARRLGPAGPDYVNAEGRFEGEVEKVTEGGKVFGFSLRYRDLARNGRDAWVADAATGALTLLGLTGGEFTGPAGERVSRVDTENVTESGFALGYSALQGRDEEANRVPWVADAATGVTRRLNPAGEGNTVRWPYGVTEAGLVWGASGPPASSGGAARAGWVLDAKTGREEHFILSVRESDGHHSSTISGITPEGIVYGVHTLYQNGADAGQRAFLWSEGLGVLLLGGSAGAYEFSSVSVHARGLVVGYGRERATGHPRILVGGLSGPSRGARVTGLTLTEEGKHRLSFHTDTPVRITLQASIDLSTWVDGIPQDIPAGASHMDIATDPASEPRKYWRLKTEPVPAP